MSPLYVFNKNKTCAIRDVYGIFKKQPALWDYLDINYNLIKIIFNRVEVSLLFGPYFQTADPLSLAFKRLIMMYLSVDFFGFIFLEFYSTWIWWFPHLIKFGELIAIIF